MKYLVWVSPAAWIIIWFTGFLSGTSPTVVHAELALILFCLGVGLVYLFKSPSTPFCWTLFWIFHAYFIFVPSLATYVSKLSTWGTFYTLDDYQAGYMIYSGWIVAVVTGYAYRKQPLRHQSFRWPPLGKSNFIISILSLPLIAALVSNPGLFVTERHELSAYMQESDFLGYFIIGSKMLFLTSAVYAVNVWKSDRRVIWFSMRVGMTALVLLVFNPFANARYVFLGADLAILGSWIPLRKSAMISLVLLGPILIFFVLPFTKVIFDADAISREASRDTKEYLLSTEFDTFQQSMNAVQYVAENGFNYGSQLLAAPLFWVPRSLFPDKPDSSGIIVADFMGYKFLNLALPLYSEWYLAIGLPGVLGFGFVWGIILRTVDTRGSRFQDSHSDGSFWRLNSLLLGSFSFILYRGSLGACAAPIGAMVAGVIALWMFTRLRLGARS